MEVTILMKKFLSLFLCLTCILTLVACGKKAAPITLPQADKITSIDITTEENTVSHSDKTWISEIIADISSSEPTKKGKCSRLSTSRKLYQN